LSIGLLSLFLFKLIDLKGAIILLKEKGGDK
jgi:hypothetical protein